MQNPTNTTTKGNNHAKFLGITPIPERREFIKFLYREGFTVTEINKVYPTMNSTAIKKILEKI